MNKKIKKSLEYFWNVLWKDESLKGWIFSVIILFLLIKFIFFPFLNLLTGTSLPLAIVESCSMYHGEILQNYNSWWQEHENKYDEFNIKKQEFKTFPLKNGFNKGDILLLTRANPEKLKIGDIIIFNANQANPVIHRIIKITKQGGKKYFSTIGDNNNGQHEFEKKISEEELVGKAMVKIAPYIGWLKLIFFENKRSFYERGFCRVK